MRQFTLFIALIVCCTVAAWSAPPPPKDVGEATNQLMMSQLQTVLVAVANAPAPVAHIQQTKMVLASVSIPTKIDFSTPAEYLVISAGVSNDARTINIGGKILTVTLSPIAYETLGLVFSTLGAQDNTLALSSDFTLPAYKFKLLFFTIKGRNHLYHLMARAQLMNGDQLKQLQSALKLSGP